MVQKLRYALLALAGIGVLALLMAGSTLAADTSAQSAQSAFVGQLAAPKERPAGTPVRPAATPKTSEKPDDHSGRPLTKPKGRPIHVVGTVVSYSPGSITVAPRKGGANVTFITTDARIVGYGTGAQTSPTPQVGDRVNVVGRTAPDGTTNTARVIVIQGPAEPGEDD